jgi:hypothetical protein
MGSWGGSRHPASFYRLCVIVRTNVLCMQKYLYVLYSIYYKNNPNLKTIHNFLYILICICFCFCRTSEEVHKFIENL